MSRPRKSNNDLPPMLQRVRGRYYFKASCRAVRDAVGAWTFPLGADVTAARAKWAELLEKASLLRIVHHRQQLEDRPDVTTRGFIYAIRAGESGPVKIGFSSNEETLRERVRALQPGAADRLAVLGFATGSVRQEKLCHRALAEFRMEGEWFQPHPVALEFVNRLVHQGVRAALLHNCNPQVPVAENAEVRVQNSASPDNNAIVMA